MHFRYSMHFSRSILVLLLTLALSLQVMAAGDDAACHHEQATSEMMAQMDSDCGDHDVPLKQSCCDTDCQCTSHMAHTSVFIPEDNALTVATKPSFQRLFALQQHVRQPHFPHYRPPRIA